MSHTGHVQHTNNGLTLIELMVAVALVAILAGIAVPSFSGLLQNNRMTSGHNEFVAALQLARAETIKRGGNVFVTATNAGNPLDEWGAGLTVWVDLDLNTALGPGEAITIIPASANGLTYDGQVNIAGVGQFNFLPNGRLNAGFGQRFDFFICDDNRTGEDGRLIRITASGQISTRVQVNIPANNPVCIP